MAGILIVDDEEDICDYLKDILGEMGHEVRAVLTGDEAMKLVDERKWQVAFVDIKLSTTISGMDVIRTLREKQPKTIVVVITGYVDIGMIQEAKRLGVRYYFEKPDDLRPSVLEEKMKTIESEIEQD